MKGWITRKSISLVFVAIALAAFWVFDDSGILRGLALREPFADGKPVSYWIEVVKAAWPDLASKETTGLWDSSAIPVLKRLLRDEDEVVRATAVYVLSGLEDWNEVEPLILEALREDPSAEVEYQAIEAFALQSRNSQSAIPCLSAIATKGRDEISRIHAHSALWMIDENAAIKAGGWKAFSSELGGYTIWLPSNAVEKRETVNSAAGEFDLSELRGNIEGSYYSVTFAAYPSEVRSVSARCDAIREHYLEEYGTAPKTEKETEIGELAGRDWLFELDGHRAIHRYLVRKNRVYDIHVVLPNAFADDKVAAFVFDSFVPHPTNPQSSDSLPHR